MSKKLKVELPSNIEDIKLVDYQEYIVYLSRITVDGEYHITPAVKMEIISIFTKIPTTLLRDGIEVSDIDLMYSQIMSVLQIVDAYSEREVQPTFIHRDIEFGLIPDFKNMSAGEFIDLSGYIKDWGTMHLAMAVLYRPIVNKKHNVLLNIEQYEIMKYNGTDELEDFMKDVPAYLAVDILFFLKDSYKKLVKLFLAYLDKLIQKRGKKMSEEQLQILLQQKEHLNKNMDGIIAFI